MDKTLMSRTSNVVALGKCTEKLQVMIPPAMLEDLHALRRQRADSMPLADFVRSLILEATRGRKAILGAPEISQNEALLVLAVINGVGADVEGFKRQIIKEYVGGQLHDSDDGCQSPEKPRSEDDSFRSFQIGSGDGL